MSDAPDRRRALLRARRDAARRLAELSTTYESIVTAASMEALDDEHDPDGATVGFERAQVAALLDAARRDVTALDDALDRIGAGEADRCERCGIVIPAERLATLPATRRCVACATPRGPWEDRAWRRTS